MGSMRRLSLLLFSLIAIVVTSTAAYADCYKDGQRYPTGTVIDGFICTADGRWVKA